MKKILLLTSVLFLFSCDRNEHEIQPHENLNLENKHFVSYERITKIVNNNNFKNFISRFHGDARKKKSLISDSLIITESKEFKDKDSVTAFYFTKLSNNQFVIFPADDRSHAVMGVMDNENDLKISDLPTEFSYWIEEEIDAIEYARDNNLQQTEEIEKEWLNLSRIAPIDDPTICYGAYHETKSPLLTTNWGQGYSYNALTPNLGCSSGYLNGHAPTGCVATAAAQIMKYFQHPVNYNWSEMPNNYGSIATAQLMSDIGSVVSMDYDCSGSGTKTQKLVQLSPMNSFNPMKNIFGYSDAQFGDYNYNTVVSEISQNKPVIISGGEKKYWIGIFAYYADGHAWVADGYMRGFECFYDDNGNVNGGYGYLLLHLNWGWDGSFNGYFGFNNFSVNNDSYNYKNKMVYGIRK